MTSLYGSLNASGFPLKTIPNFAFATWLFDVGISPPLVAQFCLLARDFSFDHAGW